MRRAVWMFVGLVLAVAVVPVAVVQIVGQGKLRGSLAADQMGPGGIYFGTASGVIYGSDDLGESWREVASGLPRIMSVEAYAN